MRRHAEATKTTLLGGVLVILPLWVSTLLLAKAALGMHAFVSPVTAQLPPEMHLRRIAAIVIIVLICFIAGGRPRRPPAPCTSRTARAYT